MCGLSSSLSPERRGVVELEIVVPRLLALATLVVVTLVASTLTVTQAEPSSAAITMDTWVDGGPISTISPAGPHVTRSQIVEAKGSLIAVWLSESGDRAPLSTSYSRDRGVTWSAPRTLATNSFASTTEFDVVSNAGVVTVVWQAPFGSVSKVQTTSSPDGGKSWSTVVGLGSAQASGPRVVATTAGPVIAWTEGARSPDAIHASRSTDGGRTWSTPAIAYTNAAQGVRLVGFVFDTRKIVAVGATYIRSSSAWESRLISVSSADAGNSWGPPTDLHAVTATNIASFVQTASANGGIVVSWDVGVGTTQYATSHDSGQTWVVRGNTPFAKAENQRLYEHSDSLMWVAPFDAFDRFSISTNGGRSWSTPRDIGEGRGSGHTDDVIVADGVIYAAGFNGTVRMSYDGGRTWTREGDMDGRNNSGNLTRLAPVGGAVIAYWTDPVYSGARLRSAAVIESTRIAGADRYETARRISQQFAPMGRRSGSVVYIATGADFPDALVAASAAAKRGGPLLLSPPSGLHAETVAELRRLTPQRVVIAGGTGALSARVQSQVADVVGANNVKRLGGATRYETARLIIEDAFPQLTGVYLATGRDFADALAATSAAASQGAAVMITDGKAGSLDANARRIVDSNSVRSVRIAGGTAVVSSGIERQLRNLKGSNAVARIAGADRYATSALLNKGAGPFGPTVYYATGASFADALGGAALAGATGSALFTVPRTCVPQAVLSQLGGKRDVRLLGGVGALWDTVLDSVPC